MIYDNIPRNLLRNSALNQVSRTRQRKFDYCATLRGHLNTSWALVNSAVMCTACDVIYSDSELWRMASSMAHHCRAPNDRSTDQHRAGGHVTDKCYQQDGRAVIRVEMPPSTHSHTPQRRHRSADRQTRDESHSPVLRVGLRREPQPEVYTWCSCADDCSWCVVFLESNIFTKSEVRIWLSFCHLYRI